MQIVYFPYLHLQELEELPFGNVRVWNFKKKSEQYIADTELRNQITTLMQTNIRGNNPIEDMGILSIGNTDFREFTNEEFKTANEIRLIMFLAHLSKNNVKAVGPNSGWLIGTSENFSLTVQNFQPGNNYVAEDAGFIVHIGIGGYEVGEVKFKAPSHVPTPMRFSLDGLLIKQLLYLKKYKKRLFERILRATDLLFESYFNDSNVSKMARILLQVGSMEVLLDLPEEGQRKALKSEIGQLLNSNDGENAYYFEVWSAKDKKMIKIKDKASQKVIWADRFYTLRNHLIHGQNVKISEYYFHEQRHLDIATMFFVLLVKKIINEARKLKIFYDEISWKEFQNSNGDNITGFFYEDNDLIAAISRALSKPGKRP